MPLMFREAFPGHTTAGFIIDASVNSIDCGNHPWLRSGNHNANGSDIGQVGSLCSTCRQLNFEYLFRQPLSQVKVAQTQEEEIPLIRLTDGICLGFVDEIRRRQDCVFCTLVTLVLSKQCADRVLPSSIDSQRVECYIMNIVQETHKISMDFTSALARNEPYALQLNIKTQPLLIPDPLLTKGSASPTSRIQLLADPGLEKSTGCYGRLMSNTTIDFRLLANWINDCQASPRRTQLDRVGLLAEDPFRIRLIDIKHRCLVECRLHGKLDDFAALSYMWGSQKPLMLLSTNLAELEEEDSLSPFDPRIPRTIKDAMLLCERLEEAYLWVDSLCIMQNTSEALDQIKRMDSIYQSSKFTIVAAHGIDSEAGLPGVRPSSRILEQRVIDVRGLKLANVLPQFTYSVDNSLWNTRGWTYQERLLSERKLVFTSDQVYFQCDHGDCSEDTYSTFHQSSVLNEFPPSENESLYKIRLRNAISFDVYTMMVEEYTRRDLSHKEDIVNAFEGVLQILNRRFFMMRPVVFGIPLCILDISLLWHPAKALCRRSGDGSRHGGFPSWSWAGWIGPIEYQFLMNASERTILCATWLDGNQQYHQERPLPSTVTGRPPPSWPHWDKWERYVSRYEEIYYVEKNGDPECWLCHPIDSARTLPVTDTPMDSTGTLHLIAEVATLKITEEHSTWSSTCTSDSHDVCNLVIFDSQGHRAGIAVVDGTTAQAIRKRPQGQSFIKLSQTALTSGRDDPSWDPVTESYIGVPGAPAINPQPNTGQDDELFDLQYYDANICWCLYNVLMVEWQDNVAYRLGIGLVHIHAFDAAEPVKNRLLLG